LIRSRGSVQVNGTRRATMTAVSDDMLKKMKSQEIREGLSESSESRVPSQPSETSDLQSHSSQQSHSDLSESSSLLTDIIKLPQLPFPPETPKKKASKVRQNSMTQISDSTEAQRQHQFQLLYKPPVFSEVNPSSNSIVICFRCLVRIPTSITAIESLNRYYHPYCFVCASCSVSMLCVPFFVHQDTLYCMECYQKCAQIRNVDQQIDQLLDWFNK